MTKIKLCLIAPFPPPYGGISNWAIMFRDYIKSNNIADLSIINIAPFSRGIDGRTIWERVVVQGILMFKTCAMLVKEIKTNRPDIIHMTTSGQLAIIRDILLLLTAKIKGVPTVYHIRFGRINEIAQNKTTEWKLISIAMKLSSKVMAIDSTTHNTIKKKLPSVNAVCVPNPVNLNALPEPIECKSNIITFLGWVVKTKGIEELLQAWEKVYEKYQSWQLNIIGPCDEKYKEYLNANFPDKGIVFFGEKPHNESMNLLNNTKIFILPSYTEGFPNAVVEAMALKKAIIATSVGAIPDMLSDDCGMVIPPKNSAAVEDTLTLLINDEKKQEELGLNAYKKAHSLYSIEKVMELYKTEWEEIVKNKN